MQPRRTRDQFDLYDAMVRADSIVGRTRLVLDAPLHAVATSTRRAGSRAEGEHVEHARTLRLHHHGNIPRVGAAHRESAGLSAAQPKGHVRLDGRGAGEGGAGAAQGGYAEGRDDVKRKSPQ